MLSQILSLKELCSLKAKDVSSMPMWAELLWTGGRFGKASAPGFKSRLLPEVWANFSFFQGIGIRIRNGSVQFGYLNATGWKWRTRHVGLFSLYESPLGTMDQKRAVNKQRALSGSSAVGWGAHRTGRGPQNSAGTHRTGPGPCFPSRALII